MSGEVNRCDMTEENFENNEYAELNSESTMSEHGDWILEGFVMEDDVEDAEMTDEDEVYEDVVEQPVAFVEGIAEVQQVETMQAVVLQVRAPGRRLRNYKRNPRRSMRIKYQNQRKSERIRNRNKFSE